MNFVNKGVAKLNARFSDSQNTITFQGVTTANTTPENAKAQADKLLAVVGKAITTTGMTRVITQEAM